MDETGLRVEAENSKCSFKYTDKDGSWKTFVDNADARMITTSVAGGFAGATAGPHVRLDN